jgi:hypothetical protein
MRMLGADPPPTDRASLARLVADATVNKLLFELEATKVWRDNIAKDCVATVDEDGRIRWFLPQYAPAE